jgi:hypothetical protein
VAIDNILTGNSQPREYSLEPGEGIEIVAPGAAGKVEEVGGGVAAGFITAEQWFRPSDFARTPTPNRLHARSAVHPSQASPADAAPGPGPQRKRVSTSPNQATASPYCTGCSLVANERLIRLQFVALARILSFPKQ